MEDTFNEDKNMFIQNVNHNMSLNELNLFIQLHRNMELEHQTFIRRTLRLEDIEHVYYNEKLLVFETRYKNGEWTFLRQDGGWI